MGTGFPPIEDLVPHGSPLRMLDAMVSWERGRATCSMVVRPTSPFVQGGRLGSAVLLEALAQSVAACLGYEAFLGGAGVRVGMIVAVRKMDLLRPWIPVGTELALSVERKRGDEDVSTFSGEARDPEGVIVTASMTLVHSASPPRDRA